MSYTYECNWAGAAAIAAAAATVNEHIFQLFPFCPQIHSVFCSFTLHLPFSISPIALHLSVSFSPPLQNFWICSELSFNDQNRQTATPLNCYMNKVALFNETYMRLIVCGLLSSTNWIRITCYFFPSCKPRKKIRRMLVCVLRINFIASFVWCVSSRGRSPATWDTHTETRSDSAAQR